ncbi:hypothetical protein [Tsukamurella paurometabola]|uniref:Uncharacterized protein n=1 Tax=Tsukamurella paurometabola TaxID=2061 RepID=A0ABS5NJJ4_TSUPA|nr:hypothetical protein [Tsukamurella paurometabola]MBS4104458.1 hypothetical protein [Tsukamurella paurometabola]UEA85397.1 hypothetical protein LK411_11510 [Tsukamurella paurometabola]
MILRNALQIVSFSSVLVGCGAIGYGAWVWMHLAAIDICGMAVDAGGRMAVNFLGLLGMGASVVLGGAVGGLLVYGETRRHRVAALVPFLLLVVVLALMQWWSASSFDASCGGAR